ncbi:MAG: S8 family serine peptidase [Anaerolineales bacterium]|nr:S8 family serine peptidase [Anaerolineales bacterium]
MSYKVFYGSVNNDGSFYNAEGLAALEDIAMDGADVLNNSWGGGPSSNGYDDPLEIALANTAASGVFISMSAGNAGPSNSTVDHPRSEYINVAASTTSGTLASGRIDVPGHPEVQDIAFSVASFGAPLPIATVITYPVLPSESVNPANTNGCNAWPAGTFTGKAALIRRGDCEFGVKVLNAENGGADFVIVYNSVAGGDELINMGPGEVGDQVTISSIFVGHTNGQAIVDAYVADPAVEVVLNTIAFQAGNTPDLIASFSSRGPGVGPALVPDIAAPGVNILAQGYTPGASGEAQYLGYGQASGTSMAAPHVAGAAVLVRQAHPNWSNAEIKSALMSTAKYTDVYNYNGSPAQPLDMGAGRLDLTRALAPGVILNPPKLSYGVVPSPTSKTLEVWVTSVATQTETYQLSTLYTGERLHADHGAAGFYGDANFGHARTRSNPGGFGYLRHEHQPGTR